MQKRTSIYIHITLQLTQIKVKFLLKKKDQKLHNFAQLSFQMDRHGYDLSYKALSTWETIFTSFLYVSFGYHISQKQPTSLKQVNSFHHLRKTCFNVSHHDNLGPSNWANIRPSVFSLDSVQNAATKINTIQHLRHLLAIEPS